MKILVLDNYDSFTYNLVHIIKHVTAHQVDVVRNDEITPEEVQPYDRILLSPGPGIPEEAGIMKELIRRYGSSKSILGICLGMQGIAEVYGAAIYNLNKVYHGIESDIRIPDARETLFTHLPSQIRGGRYHSWAVDQESLPDELEITATDNSGIIMAIRHKNYDVKGLQFHPESVMTPHGKNIMLNWFNPDNEKLSSSSSDNDSYNIHDTKHGYLFC
ncbi:MAG: anthranilate synthase component II [Bacteroidales bacterium]